MTKCSEIKGATAAFLILAIFAGITLLLGGVVFLIACDDVICLSNYKTNATVMGHYLINHPCPEVARAPVCNPSLGSSTISSRIVFCIF